MNHKDLGVAASVFEKWLSGEVSIEKSMLLDERRSLYESSRRPATVNNILENILVENNIRAYELALILGVSLSTLKTWQAGSSVSRIVRYALYIIEKEGIDNFRNFAKAESDV